jgi:exopolyphosphatase/guanosine-5'-triphosphate,3'-diphosphate pyrophosphatase
VHPVRRAVIDVGTNSIKLLVADVHEHEVMPVLERSKQTRLGSGFYESHQLQAGPIKATAEAVAAFAQIAREQNSSSIRVIGTSAAREAVNSKDLISAVHAASELQLEVISGEMEADLVFQGITTDRSLAQAPLLLLDAGGGSTEFIVGQGEQKHFQASFLIGTVRLLEKMPPSDPPLPKELEACRSWLRNFLDKEVKPQLETAMRREVKSNQEHAPVQLVATGGTATILARMEGQMSGFDRDRIENTRLTRDRLSWHMAHLWGSPLEKRKQIVGLPENRADVILMGVAIYDAVMNVLDFSNLRISTRGLRFAAVLLPAKNL